MWKLNKNSDTASSWLRGGRPPRCCTCCPPTCCGRTWTEPAGGTCAVLLFGLVQRCEVKLWVANSHNVGGLTRRWRELWEISNEPCSFLHHRGPDSRKHCLSRKHFAHRHVWMAQNYEKICAGVWTWPRNANNRALTSAPCRPPVRANSTAYRTEHLLTQHVVSWLTGWKTKQATMRRYTIPQS